ncbi:hypothetical protein Fmac_013369 [Flemingia macrophylla]|uniref:Desiccation-related protein PCC13-62 n=1 Tax=Flemingia macrophylla TaxID=520843 RepID=A0ABD1MSX1_9FABA
MALHATVVMLASLVFSGFVNVAQSQAPNTDVDLLNLVQNMEFLTAEYLLYGVTGLGLDAIAPELAQGGPPPVGGRLAFLDPFLKDVYFQFALQKVGHLRAIRSVAPGIPRPLLNISKNLFADFVDATLGRRLVPRFDPYANSLNYALGFYGVSYFAPTGYVGISPELQNSTFKRLTAGLMGVEFGQEAVTRSYLYERRNHLIASYNVTVTELTNGLADLRNTLGGVGTISEGLVVPPSEGAEGRVSGNVLAGNNDSLAYGALPRALLRILYGGGDEHVPGAFYPKGANGRIAQSYLNSPMS